MAVAHHQTLRPCPAATTLRAARRIDDAAQALSARLRACAMAIFVTSTVMPLPTLGALRLRLGGVAHITAAPWETKETRASARNALEQPERRQRTRSGEVRAGRGAVALTGGGGVAGRPISKNCSAAARTGCAASARAADFTRRHAGAHRGLDRCRAVARSAASISSAPYEQGVVLRFGAFVARTAPGINYHLPWPIETAYTLEGHAREPDQHRLSAG